MPKKIKIIAVLIAYNVGNTLEDFYKELPKKIFDEIILFDDASSDKTFKIAQRLGIVSHLNKTNLGYGGNLKKALSIALWRNAEIIVDIHPDGEYKTDVIPAALEQIKNGSDLVLGNRFHNINYIFNKSGMFFWKVIPIIILNKLSKTILRTNISDLHQGFRIYTKKLLEKINFEENSNNYIFSFELIAQSVYANAKISEVPVQTKYAGKKRGASFVNSLKYSLGIFKILFLFSISKIGLKSKIFEKPQTSLKIRTENQLKEYNIPA